MYEHFGTKDGLYRVVVAEEMERLESDIADSISRGRSRARIERAVVGLLTYVEEHTDGFTILARDPGSNTGLATLLGNATGRVSHILGAAFTRAGLVVANPAGRWGGHRTVDRVSPSPTLARLTLVLPRPRLAAGGGNQGTRCESGTAPPL